jgi:hypothetical protein
MQSVENQLKFWMKISSPSSGSKNKSSGFLLWLLFGHEDGGDMSVDFQRTSRLIFKEHRILQEFTSYPLHRASCETGKTDCF